MHWAAPPARTRRASERAWLPHAVRATAAKAQQQELFRLFCTTSVQLKIVNGVNFTVVTKTRDYQCGH